MSARLVAVDEVAQQSDTGAPIVLVTGLPGAGKSLFALAEFAVGKQGVYQAGIPGCQLPAWEPEKWQDLPAGSTLIVDEAQDFFPPKSPTSEPPAHYVANKIRHKGISLVLLTQHPNMLDARVRRLCGRHVHVVRAFGEEAAVLYEWRHAGDVDSTTKEGATRSGWKYPKEVYRLYKSSDRHREMQKAPLKVRAIPYVYASVLLLVVGGGWMVYHRMSALAHGEAGKPAAAAGGGPRQANRAVGSAAGADRAVPLTAAEYAESFKPRVAGLEYSAPRYDQVTKPVRAPVPAGCVATATKCSCYSQQATPLQVGDAMCRQIVAGGYFKDFDDGDDVARSAPAGTGARGVAPVQSGALPVGGVPAVSLAVAGAQAVAPGSALIGVGGHYAPGH